MRILIVYGTKYGSTTDVSNRLAEKLRDNGADVDVFDIKQSKPQEIHSYDRIVLGSSIFVGAWTKEMQQFISENIEAWKSQPMYYFACCGDMVFGTKDVESCHDMYVIKAAENMGLPEPRASSVLGGFFDFSRYGLLVKAVLQAKGLQRDMKQNGMDVSQPYDFRDWDAVDRLATRISEL